MARKWPNPPPGVSPGGFLIRAAAVVVAAAFWVGCSAYRMAAPGENWGASYAMTAAAGFLLGFAVTTGVAGFVMTTRE